MLQMRPNRECRDRDLAPNGGDARIRGFECTFCADCAETRLEGRCPNCGGELVVRPSRAATLLAKFPGSAERVLKGHGACA